MTFEYVCGLKTEKEKPGVDGFPSLASGFVDWAALSEMMPNNKKERNNEYVRNALKEGKGYLAYRRWILPCSFQNIDVKPKVLRRGWCGIHVEFELQRPWFSRDDRCFHPLYNPLRKDRVFGVPYMSAASWKGLLRWACRMKELKEGLLEYLEHNGGRFDGWRDPPWITHLFGNAKGEEEEFARGALLCHPTWFDRIGFEVINPHSRETRAGTKPIIYEVVPANAEARGRLRLLYAPLPPADPNPDAVSNLLEAIRPLIEDYGFSAKRTAGWGIAKICKWTVMDSDNKKIQRGKLCEIKKEIDRIFGNMK